MILAVDPGIASCGWAIVTPGTGRVLELGVIASDRDDRFDVTADRARRADRQAEALLELVRRHDCKAIAAESVSIGGPPHVRTTMALSLSLSWGVLVGLARTLGLALYEATPKVWQHAVQPDAGKKIDYDKLFAAMARYVRGQAAAEQLAALRPSHRNHALDAAGVGLLAALRPSAATTIVKGRSEA